MTKVTKEKLTKVLKQHPTLGIQGFTFKPHQKTFYTDLEKLQKVVNWLDRIKKIKSNNKSRDSYSLKHLVEKYIGYTTNGQFIVASIMAGFKPYGINGILGESKDCTFNMSSRSFNRVIADIRKKGL